MKTSLLSLVIAISVAILSLLQFDRYQKFTQATLQTLAQLDKKINAKLNDFDKDVSRIKDQEQNILAQVQSTLWKAREAEYFVSLAETRLQVNRDVSAAIELLTLAEQKVTDINDPNLENLQHHLKTDLRALQEISVPDLEAVWLSVSSIIAASQKLSPKHSTLNSAAKESKATIPAGKADDSWKNKLIQSLEEIKTLVKIRRYSKPIEPLLSENQQSMVQEILRSLLEQIRFAALATEDKLYQKSIQETEEWLASYYETNDINVKNIQEDLKKLSEVKLRPALPKLGSVAQFATLRQ